MHLACLFISEVIDLSPNFALVSQPFIGLLDSLWTAAGTCKIHLELFSSLKHLDAIHPELLMHQKKKKKQKLIGVAEELFCPVFKKWI